MEVAIVVPGALSTVSGGYLYDRRLVEYLRSCGHSVEVITINAQSYAGRLLDNVTRSVRPFEDFDVVLEDGLAHPSLLRINRVLSVPTVGILHMLLRRNVVARFRRGVIGAIESYYLRQLDAVIHNSRATRDAARRRGAPLAGIVAPPGGNRFAPESTEADIRARSSNGPIEVLYLGNVIERKGLGTLVEALGLARVEWHLTVVGDLTVEPEYVERVQNRIRKLGTIENIEMVGRVPDEAVEDYLTRTDVLAIPSRYEPFGIAYLEGMSFGCVPVASDRGGPTDFIEDGVSGIITPPEAHAIATRLSALRDRKQLADMGIAARQAYHRQPTWDESMGRIERFLEAIVATKSGTTDTAHD